ESEPSSRRLIAPGSASSRSTLTDFAWANLCSRSTLPPPRPTAAAVLVSTRARARRQRKTRPVDGGGEGGSVLTGSPILLPGRGTGRPPPPRRPRPARPLPGPLRRPAGDRPGRPAAGGRRPDPGAPRGGRPAGPGGLGARRGAGSGPGHLQPRPGGLRVGGA